MCWSATSSRSIARNTTRCYIKVTLGEPYPRVLFSRQMKKDGSRYFGPFTSAGAVKDTIDLIRKVCHIRSCSRVFPDSIGKERPCLNYHIGQCPGVCTGKITPEEYDKNVREALDFLNGHYRPILSMLEEKMERASENMEFEKAAEYRDLLGSVRACAEKQKVTNAQERDDKDIIALAQKDEDAVIQIFFIRGGKMVGREHFFMTVRIEEEPSEILRQFLQQFYSNTPFVPREIYMQTAVAGQDVMEEWLSDKKGRRVYLKVPQKGMKNRLVELAARNAETVLEQDKERLKKEEGRTIGAQKEIAAWLGMEKIERVEAFDISTIHGFQTVGSMVVFEKGKPLKSAYRKFKLRTVHGPDDYASMREVLTRRFTHGLAEREELQAQGRDEELGGFSRFPDLIMMDGGLGQVNICREVLEELQIEIPVCGMVKDDHHRTRGLYYNGVEIPISRDSEGFRLITRVQDEAHRFAIEYHRLLRRKGQVSSVLDNVPGIGPKRRRELMRYFSGTEEMAQASVETLAQVPGMDARAAQAVYRHLHAEGGETLTKDGKTLQ